MNNTQTEKLPALLRPAPFLRRHAVERVLERSTRAPSWLSNVLRAGQFVHLHVGAATGKRCVLVFDPLSDAYLVPILAPVSQQVITLLTRDQYENVHGAIAPVFLKLAQLARVQPLKVTKHAAGPGVSDGLQLRELPSPWQAPWRVVLAIAARGGIKKHSVRALLDTPWRQQCVLDALGVAEAAVPLPEGGCAGDLSFERQAEILTKTVEFQSWMTSQLLNLRENPEFLRSVSFTSGHLAKSKVDVTAVLLAQLTL